MQPIMWRLGDEMRAKQNKKSSSKSGSSGSNNMNGMSYGVGNMSISDKDLASMSQGDHLRSRKSPQSNKSPSGRNSNNAVIYK